MLLHRIGSSCPNSRLSSETTAKRPPKWGVHLPHHLEMIRIPKKRNLHQDLQLQAWECKVMNISIIMNFHHCRSVWHLCQLDFPVSSDSFSMLRSLFYFFSIILALWSTKLDSFFFFFFFFYCAWHTGLPKSSLTETKKVRFLFFEKHRSSLL